MRVADHAELETVESVAVLGVPPHNLEAEQSLLGGLLMDNRAFDRVCDLVCEQDFYRGEHRSIYAAIVALCSSSRTADAVTVIAYTQDRKQDVGGAEYVGALANSVAGSSGAQRYAEIIRDKSLRRQLIAALDSSCAHVWGDGSKDTAQQCIDVASTAIGSLELKGAGGSAPRSIGQIAAERTAHYEALQDGKIVPGWPTRIPRLDRLLTGGIKPGRVYVLAARPSVGKSSFAQHIGLELAKQQIPVLFMSQEMADVELADRAVANAGRVDYGNLLTGHMQSEDWTRAVEALGALAPLPYYVHEQGALTLADIRAKARSVRGLKVLIIDYIQLCAGTRKDGNRNLEIGAITNGLKALAMQMGVAVIALSQLNRDVESRADKRPSMADLRDSGAIEQDADTVIFLWPLDDEEQAVRGVGCHVAKNRMGWRGELALNFDGGHQHWGESMRDTRQPEKQKGNRVK